MKEIPQGPQKLLFLIKISKISKQFLEKDPKNKGLALQGIALILFARLIMDLDC